MRIFATLACAFLAAIVAPASSRAVEIRVEPEVALASAPAPQAKSSRKKPSKVTRVDLPAPTFEAPRRSAHKPGTPMQIGEGRAVPQLERDAVEFLGWESAPGGGQVAALVVTSPLAAALRLGVRADKIPPAAVLRFYPEDESELFEVTGEEVLETIARNLAAGDKRAEARIYWSPVIESSSAVMEVQLPAGVDPREVKLAVPQVSHLFTSAAKSWAMPKVGESASCEINVKCDLGWDQVSNAVARMVFTISGSSFLCSGTLLADTDAATSLPYFLTANHCISTQTVAGSLQTFWFYRANTCGGTTLSSGNRTLAGGATLLHASGTTDVSFMQLNGTPPAGAVFAGWFVGTTPSINTQVTGLHHPAGDLQKKSEGAITGYDTCTPSGPGFICNSGSAGSTTFYEVQWTQGVTEGGSSGSGIFLNNGRYLVGQLYGGSSSCAFPGDQDYYGRFDVSYNSALSQWLSPPASGPQELTVVRDGTGVGNVSSAPAGITCGATCAANFAPDSSVTLTATPDLGSTFGGWSDACAGTGGCSVTMDAAKSVTASFNYQGATFPGVGGIPSGWTSSGSSWTVITGAGETYEGTNALRSQAPGDSASATLSVTGQFSAGEIRFARRVSSQAGADFLRFYVDGVLQDEWSGDVAWGMVSFALTAGAHTLTWAYEKDAGLAALTDAAWIDAVTLPAHVITHALTLSFGGAGSGTVASVPEGIACVAGCSASFAANTAVTLTATPAAGSTFAGWSGACTGVGLCGITLNAPATVTASFDIGPRKRHDVNGDGRSDVVWRDPSGMPTFWHLNGASITGGNIQVVSTGNVTVSATFSVAGIGDFNGDGKADILLRNATSGSNVIWHLDGSIVTAGKVKKVSVGSLPSLTGAWTVIGTGDFNGDGKSDILWRDPTGVPTLWNINGAAITAGQIQILSQGTLSLSTGFSVQAIGDFNGDGKADVLWRKESSGSNRIWHLDGAIITAGKIRVLNNSGLTSLASTWSVAGVGDFNGDGKSDILWRDPAGQGQAWHIDGATITAGQATVLSTGTISTAAGFVVAGVGDYNGDGRSDVLFRNATSGSNRIWHLDGNVISSGKIRVLGAGNIPSLDNTWTVVNPR